VLDPRCALGELLYRGSFTDVHRGRSAGGAPETIIRVPRDRGRAEHLARLEHERDTIAALGIEHRMGAVAGGPLDGAAALISAGAAGVTLEAQIPEAGLDVTEALELAIALARRVGEMHAARIIHKDLHPGNILIDRASGGAEPISFGIASRLPRETRLAVDPEVLEGRLEYISPEQTGRMNRDLDYRSDFYSLGATLYTMLTGAPPFASDDPMELVHAHIARPPPPLPDRIPAMVGKVVLRLLAKNAEDRYQSSHGLIADLNRYLASEDDFTLATEDHADVFEIPQRLYGREPEIEQMLAAFERVADGAAEVMLVSGYSGIGKSALVREVHKPIVARRGLFISGKFENYRRDVPYLAFVEAFRELVRQLLTQNADEVQTWRTRITEAVGELGQLLVDVIPEVELLIGEQSPVGEAGPAEAEQRFSAVFQNFIGVFAGEGQPLVLFVDDLQWADPASLNLIKLLMTNRADFRLLLVGTYRDNEVFPAHPLMVTLDDLGQTDAPLHEIVLQPLALEHVTQLVVDTLAMSAEACAELAKAMHDKTGGNPFFLRKFFETLYADSVLRRTEEGWTWSVDDIVDMPSTENIVDLMVSRIKKLSTASQDVLRWASAIGTVFDVETVAAVTEQSPEEVAAALWEAVTVGQVMPLTTYVAALAKSYRFVHDRVQQAAYSLTPQSEQPSLHVRIGRSLWARHDDAHATEVAFAIATHMNRALELITDEGERRRLAELNLETARRARQATAYSAALNSANAAATLLAPASWDTDYELMLQLTAERAQAEYLTGNFEAADALFDTIIDKARTLDGRLLVYEKKVVLQRHKAAYEDALRGIVEGLALADIEVPWHDDAERIAAITAEDGEQLRELLSERDVDGLIDLPAMTDPVDLAVMDLLAELCMIAYFFNPALIQLATTKMVRRSLNSGNCRASAAAYATYGMAIASGAGLYEEGNQFGRLAIALSQRLQDPDAECTARFWHGSMIQHWREPLARGIENLKTGTAISLRAGAPVYASYNAFFIPVHTLFSCDHLRELLDVYARYIGLLELQSSHAEICYKQEVLCLTGAIPGRGELDGDVDLAGEPFVETEFFRDMVEEKKLVLSEQHYYNAKQRCYVYFNRNEEALKMWTLAHEKGDLNLILFGQLTTVAWTFYRVMALAAAQPDALEEIEQHIERIDVWAANCPENFEAMRCLAHAERARVKDEIVEAMSLYDEAIEAASTHGFRNISALAAEKAARFHLAGGRARVAQPYLQHAFEQYTRWGALAKCDALAEEFVELAPDAAAADDVRAASLDVATVAKAYAAISREIVLDKLLERIMDLLRENAGAQRGVLLVVRDGKLQRQGRFPETIVNYVQRTREAVVIDDVATNALFRDDVYFASRRARSALCLPVEHQGKLTAILYLENELTSGAFTTARVALLELLLAQAAISLENAQLYAQQEELVAARTRDLKDALAELGERHEELQRAQVQLIQSEKLASLGQLVAGIAHEINNPINFIASGLPSLRRDLGKLSELVPEEARDAKIRKVEARVQRLLDAIEEGASRTSEIVTNLRTFSRLDEAEFKPANVHQALDTTLMLLTSELRNGVTIERRYGDLPQVSCFISELNQVFMNVFVNALHAMPDGGTLTITTSQPDPDHVRISIADTGGGIPDSVQQKIFDPFFTTKPVGSGTGLGLSISHGIVQKHHGVMGFTTTLGEGTDFHVTLPVDQTRAGGDG